MSTIKDGGPAYPSPEIMASQAGDYYPPTQGMSLRDWFAGHALSGYLARTSTIDSRDRVKQAYAIADAMLAEREKGND